MACARVWDMVDVHGMRLVQPQDRRGKIQGRAQKVAAQGARVGKTIAGSSAGHLEVEKGGARKQGQDAGSTGACEPKRQVDLKYYVLIALKTYSPCAADTNLTALKEELTQGAFELKEANKKVARLEKSQHTEIASLETGINQTKDLLRRGSAKLEEEAMRIEDSKRAELAALEESTRKRISDERDANIKMQKEAEKMSEVMKVA